MSNTQPRSVLVLDDDEVTVRLASQVIRKLGHEVHDFTEENPARMFLRENRVDIVVSDLQLSEGDSIGLLEWIRSSEPFSRLVIMTGSSQITKLLQCWRLGVDSCVLKGKSFKQELERAVNSAADTVQRWKSAIDCVRTELNT